MLKSSRTGLIVKSIALCVLGTGASQAALIDRGGGLVYDDVLNVTWLQDTTYSVTSGYDVDPLLTFDRALDFAANATFHDRIRNVTWNDWRLPTVTPGAIAGYDPTGGDSELGYMYYVNLGLSPIYPGDGKGEVKRNLYFDLVNRGYWTGSVVKPDRAIWVFQFGYGNLDTTGSGDPIRAWLVRDGDVGAPPTGVPEPTTLALLAVGLLGTALARRRRAS